MPERAITLFSIGTAGATAIGGASVLTANITDFPAWAIGPVFLIILCFWTVALMCVLGLGFTIFDGETDV